MKSLRFVLFLLLLSVSVAFAQSAAPTDAQKSFTQLKTLAGTWQGPVTVVPPQPEMGDGTFTQVSLRVTSRGNAIVHEMHEPGKADDPTRYDHPVTMLYLDGDRLLLTHYCDAGNRPRMTGKVSPDGKRWNSNFSTSPAATVRAHVPCRVHHHRCRPSHRGVDYFMPEGKPP